MDQEGQAAAVRASSLAGQRPQSRASTSSAHSVTTQANMDQSRLMDGTDIYAGQWIPDDRSNQKGINGASQMNPDVMMLHAATQMQNAGQDFTMDEAMAVQMGHQMQFHQQQQQQHQQQPQPQQPRHPHPQALARHPLPADHFGANASFTDGDSQMMDPDGDDDSMAAITGVTKSSSARSSANNELEMRQLFAGNRHRGLQDVAGELHGNERGPNSERTRQVFAMLWINQVCSKGKGSVPRGRVYAHYASRCATERITVLNPASFGKLVRVLFPGLKTRRLGVRGESKYHYVNFALAEDPAETTEPPPVPVKSLSGTTAARSQSVASRKSGSASGAAGLPSPEVANVAPATTGAGRSDARSHSLYNLPELASIENMHATSHKTPMELSLLTEEESNFDQSENVALPPIEAFLPQGTDPDAAKSLSALYRSHCTSLVECIRYCREKTFFHLYTSFQGTLTMPVQKLFAKPELAPWIEGCDLVLYQRMMSIVSRLTLQVLPKPVMATLRSISEKLVPHIRDSFQGQPHHVIRAKEAPATLFAGLLDRSLRVNLTAHAAANMLSYSGNRDQMYVDWIMMIRPRKVAQSVPTRGMDDLVNLLFKEMRTLLDPADVPWEVECLTIYGETPMRDAAKDNSAAGSLTGSNVLDRWVGLLRSLPSKFPYASHTDIIWCVERVGNAVMRDLTIGQGKSFGAWWVTKVWLDEMANFLAEQGGFMKMKRVLDRPVASAPRSEPASQESADKPSSNKPDLSARLSQTKNQPGRAPFPPPPSSNQSAPAANSAVDAHDDSGIGMRTPEDDFPMEKFAFTGGDGGGLMAEGDLVAEAM